MSRYRFVSMSSIVIVSFSLFLLFFYTTCSAVQRCPNVSMEPFFGLLLHADIAAKLGHSIRACII